MRTVLTLCIALSAAAWIWPWPALSEWRSAAFVFWLVCLFLFLAPACFARGSEH